MTELSEVELNRRRILGLTFRSLCAWILGILLVTCGVGVRVSPMNSHVRILLATTLVFFIFTSVVFLFSIIGKRPIAVFPAIFFLALFILWAVLGNKPPDTESLRKVYHKRLRAYIGTPFVPGGETDIGVDASGLARAALWQAMVREGIKEVNPRLLGTHLWRFWWRDLTAGDIKNGKYRLTRVTGHAPGLSRCDTSTLQMGDMAVGDKGLLMIYYGDGQWIWASDHYKKVVVREATGDSKFAWFNEPVTLVRWRIFEKR